MWRKFDKVIVKNVKRQDDESFQSNLPTIRMGEINHDLNPNLRLRLLPPNIDIADVNIDDAGSAISCSLRKEQDAWNKRFIEKIDAESHIFEAEESDATGNSLPEKDKHRIKWLHRERLEDSLTLKIGA